MVSVSVTGIDYDLDYNKEILIDFTVCMVMKHYGIDDDIFIMVDVCEISDGLKGYCYDLNEKTFQIMLESRNKTIGDIIGTLIHELIHVKQYIQNGLGKALDDPHKPEYKDCWWEKEANEQAVVLALKLSEYINRNAGNPTNHLYKFLKPN